MNHDISKRRTTETGTQHIGKKYWCKIECGNIRKEEERTTAGSGGLPGGIIGKQEVCV